MWDAPYKFILIKDKNCPIPETALVNITLTLFLLSQMWNEQILYFHPGPKPRNDNVYLTPPLKQDVTQVHFLRAVPVHIHVGQGQKLPSLRGHCHTGVDITPVYFF